MTVAQGSPNRRDEGTNAGCLALPERGEVDIIMKNGNEIITILVLCLFVIGIGLATMPPSGGLEDEIVHMDNASAPVCGSVPTPPPKEDEIVVTNVSTTPAVSYTHLRAHET